MVSAKVFVMTSGDTAAVQRTLRALAANNLPKPTAIILDEPYGWRLEGSTFDIPLLGTKQDFFSSFKQHLGDSKYFIIVKDDARNIDTVQLQDLEDNSLLLDSVPDAVSFILSGVSPNGNIGLDAQKDIRVIASTGNRDTTHSCEGAVTLYKSETIVRHPYRCQIDSFSKIVSQINEDLINTGERVLLARKIEIIRDADYVYSDENSSLPSRARSATPKFTVIISSYNRPQYIRRAVESVYRQCSADFEIVVVNDAGTPFEEYLSGFDSRLRVFNCAKNSGPGNARNIGLRNSTGKYICFVDDDDWILPNHFEILGGALDAGSYVAYGIAGRCFMDASNYIFKREVPYQQDFSRNKLVVGNYLPILSVMFRRECLAATGYFDATLLRVEDWDFWRRLVMNFEFQYIPQVTSEFRWNISGETMTSSSIDKFICIEFDVRKRLIGSMSIPAAYQADILKGNDFGFELIGMNCDKWRATPERLKNVFEVLTIEKLQQYIAWYTCSQQKIQNIVSFVSEHDRQVGKVSSRTADKFEVSIVIPLYNAVEYTIGLLKNLMPITNFDAVEIILVDNASGDGTAEFLKQLPKHIKHIQNDQNRGFAAACNQGARAAKGSFVVFLNNDTLVEPDWLEPLLEPLHKEAAVGIVGNLQIQPDSKTLHHAGVSFRADKIPYHLFEDTEPNDPRVQHARNVECVTGACMAARRSEFLEYGGFDEGYRNGFEDVELCMEYRSRGRLIRYQPKSKIYHYVSRSPGRFVKDQDNFERFMLKGGNHVTKFAEEETRELEPFAEAYRRAYAGKQRIAFLLGKDCGAMTLVRLAKAAAEYNRENKLAEFPFLILLEEDIQCDKGWPWFVMVVPQGTLAEKAAAYGITKVIPVGQSMLVSEIPHVAESFEPEYLSNIIGTHHLGYWKLSKQLALRLFPVKDTEVVICTDSIQLNDFYERVAGQPQVPLLVSVAYNETAQPDVTILKQKWLLGESLAVLSQDFLAEGPSKEFEIMVLRKVIELNKKNLKPLLLEFLASQLQESDSSWHVPNSRNTILDLLF